MPSIDDFFNLYGGPIIAIIGSMIIIALIIGITQILRELYLRSKRFNPF